MTRSGGGGPAGWVRDLVLGVRLAVGGGRSAWARLALTAVGVGLGVAVLLLAAALPAAQDARSERANARIAQMEPDVAGAESQLMARHVNLFFRGDMIRTELLDATGPNPAVPPGIDRIPGHGEMIASPALAELLASPDGELLRPRVPWTLVGTIDRTGLAEPKELVLYAGEPLGDADWQPVYGYGSGASSDPPIGIVLLAMAGSVVVLIPVLVLIAATTRIAAAARERRLAALRLVGADAGQARRLASGEALVGAAGGVLLGLVFFVVGREFAAEVSLLGLSVYAEDLLPATLPFVLVMAAVPTLAVLTALVSLRRIVAQPLGVSRESTPPRRRLLWRLVPLVLGVGLLASQAGAFARQPSDLSTALVLTGLALTGLSVPVLLPWLVQRAVDPLSGGPPSWQLAIRRIQLDSATPARAAGGIAAVLTAAVAFQTLLASAFVEDANWDRQRVGDVEGRLLQVFASDPADAQAFAGLAEIDGVLNVRTHQVQSGELPNQDYTQVMVAPCDVLATYVRFDRCADGDVFATPSQAGAHVGGGTSIQFFRYSKQRRMPTGSWTVPADVRPAESVDDGPLGLMPGTVLATPAALPADRLGGFRTEAAVLVDPAAPDVAEHVANALVPLGRDVTVYASDGSDDTMTQLRNTLLIGALVVLLLAAASLLIVSVEQVRERRRQLAALAATGVGSRTLAASVLWQATVPFGVATVASLGVGTGLGVLLMRVFDMSVTFDWVGMAVLVSAATVAVLLVTGLTLPALRNATRPEALRTE